MISLRHRSEARFLASDHYRQAITLPSVLNVAFLILILIPAVSRCCSAPAVTGLKPLSTSQYADQKKPKSHLVVLTAMLCVFPKIKEFTAQNPDPIDYFKAYREDWQNSILILQDVFCGVVPMGAENRAWWQPKSGQGYCIVQNNKAVEHSVVLQDG